MFEYLTGGQCYKCGGKVKYPDGGMTQPESPEDQMMMQQQMMGAPQQQQKRSPDVLDAYAMQLMEFIMEQMSKGASEDLLKKMLLESGIEQTDAEELIDVAKSKLEAENSNGEYERIMQQQMAQQAQQGQMMQAPMGQPNEMEQARYGGSMGSKKLKRFVNAGETNTKYNDTQNGPPDENDEWIRKMMEFEKRKGGYKNGKAISLDNYGYNDWQVLGHKNEPTSTEDAIDYFKKDFLPKVSQYPMGMREAAGDFLYNTGQDPRLYMLDQYVREFEPSMKDGLPNRTDYKVGEKYYNDFDKVYSNYESKISQLPVEKRIELLNKGRKFYYENTVPKGSTWDISKQGPYPAYEATWKDRLNPNYDISQEEIDAYSSDEQMDAAKSSNLNTANIDDIIQESQSTPNGSTITKFTPEQTARIKAERERRAKQKTQKPASTQSTTQTTNNQTSTSPASPKPVTSKLPPPFASDIQGLQGDGSPYAEYQNPMTVEEDPAEKYKFEPKPQPEDDDVVVPGSETQSTTSNVEALEPSMQPDPEAVRQLNPAYYQEVTRKNSYKDLAATKGNKALYGLSKFSSPEVALGAKAAGDFLGLGGIEALAGLAGVIGNAGLAVKTAIAQPRATETSTYDKDGQLINTEKEVTNGAIRKRKIAQDGGEWNPFVDNRRKLRVNMALYVGGGTALQGESTPYPFEQWMRVKGYPMTPGYKNNPQYQNDYGLYVEGFSEDPPPPKGGAPKPPAPPAGPKPPTTTVPPDPRQETYSATVDENPNRELALGTLTGLNMISSGTGKIAAERQQEAMQPIIQNAGNTMEAFSVFNPVDNAYGSWTPNAGPGENYKPSRTGATQAWQTTTIGKRGGQVKYEKGGTYTVTPEELMRIISMGGEVEFLD